MLSDELGSMISLQSFDIDQCERILFTVFGLLCFVAGLTFEIHSNAPGGKGKKFL